MVDNGVDPSQTVATTLVGQSHHHSILSMIIICFFLFPMVLSLAVEFSRCFPVFRVIILFMYFIYLFIYYGIITRHKHGEKSNETKKKEKKQKDDNPICFSYEKNLKYDQMAYSAPIAFSGELFKQNKTIDLENLRFIVLFL